MAYDGQLIFDTSIDTKGFQQGTSRLGDLVKGGIINDALRGLFDMIIGRVDAAMNRLDTMAQFSRVMNTLTGDVNEANKTLERTNEIVAGTAFGLDKAASAVQMFVASGMDVQKATDTMDAWADATAFYTRGTNSDLESVTTALTKMSNRGTITMREMQQLLYAGIPATQIYASAVGKSTEEVSKMMSNGELKANEFIETMNKAFKEGTDKFPSIAGTAKKAGASWAGSIDNMKAAITRGVASILENFDKMFNVKANMVKFGKAIEQVLKFIGNNLDWIIPLVGGVVGAFLSWQYIGPAISAVVVAMQAASAELAVYTALQQAGVIVEGENIAAMSLQAIMLGVLTGQISIKSAVTAIATKVQLAFNAAMEANPIGMAIALAVALIAALTALITVLKNNHDEYKQQREEVDALITAQDNLVTSIEQSESAFNENTTKLKENALYGSRLVTQLDSLYKEYKATGQGADALQNVISELNKTYDGLNLALDEETDSLNTSVEATTKYIELKTKQQQADLKQERYNELMQESASLETQRTEILAKMQSVLQDGNLYINEKIELLGDLNNEYDEINELIEDNARSLEANTKVTTSSLSKEEKAWMNAQDAIRGATDSEGNDLKALAKKYNVSTDSIVQDLLNMGYTLDEWSAMTAKRMTEGGRTIEDYADKWGVTVAEIRKWMAENEGDLAAWDEHMKDSTTDAGETIEDLARIWGVTVEEIEDWCFKNDSDIQGWKENQEDLLEEWQDAVGEHTDTVINDFEELPTELDVSLDDMIKVLNENADKYNHWKDLMVQASGKLSAGTLAKLRELGPGTSKILEDIINDTSGKKARELESAMGKAAAAGVAGAEAEFNGAYDVGMDAVDSMGSGITGNTSTAQKAAETTVVATLDTMSSSVFESQSKVKSAWETIKTTILVAFRPLIGEMQSVMGQVMQGMINKMNSMSGSLYNKAASIANGVLSRTKKAYDIHSPSKAMQDIYEMVMRGGWLGMDKKEGSLYQKSDEISEGVLQRLAGIPEGLASTFSSDMLSTISAMQSGITRMQPIFGSGSPALAAAGGNVYETNVTFNEPVNQPDVIARRISQTQRYGLAGRRN